MSEILGYKSPGATATCGHRYQALASRSRTTTSNPCSSFKSQWHTNPFELRQIQEYFFGHSTRISVRAPFALREAYVRTISLAALKSLNSLTDFRMASLATLRTLCAALLGPVQLTFAPVMRRRLQLSLRSVMRISRSLFDITLRWRLLHGGPRPNGRHVRRTCLPITCSCISIHRRPWARETWYKLCIPDANTLWSNCLNRSHERIVWLVHKGNSVSLHFPRFYVPAWYV